MRLTPFDKKVITESDVAAHIWASAEPSFLAEIINAYAHVTDKNADNYSELDDVAKDAAKSLNGPGVRFVKAMFRELVDKEMAS